MSTISRPIHYDLLRHLLPQRALDSHKGDFGHVLVLGGAAGFGGAVLLAAEAAARCGAGLTSVATHPEHLTACLTRRPELMAHGVVASHVINALLARATVLVAGPGLGQDEWGTRLLDTALATAEQRALPTVLDADALNLLAADALSFKLPNKSEWILTPHPGEAARLLQCCNTEVQADRVAAARALQTRYGGAVVLKGSGTLICFRHKGRQQVETCIHGNPGMATGGMGDVLSGIIGGLLAQGLAPADAARLGVCLHARAADLEAAAAGERGMLASDLFASLRTLLNP